MLLKHPHTKGDRGTRGLGQRRTHRRRHSLHSTRCVACMAVAGTWGRRFVPSSRTCGRSSTKSKASARATSSASTETRSATAILLAHHARNAQCLPVFRSISQSRPGSCASCLRHHSCPWRRLVRGVLRSGFSCLVSFVVLVASMAVLIAAQPNAPPDRGCDQERLHGALHQSLV